LPVEASIPDSTVSLESILCTEELRRRPSRLPDYEKENHALVALLGALLDSHSNILQTLADTILDVIDCDSSGNPLGRALFGSCRVAQSSRIASDMLLLRFLPEPKIAPTALGI
jgi:hypothetical protein